MHFFACTLAISKQKSPLSSEKRQGATLGKRMGTSERNSHSRMSHRQRGQTEDAAGHLVSGPAEASDWNSFYRATRMTRLAQTEHGDDSLPAHQTANGLFFYFALAFFEGCDALQV